MRLRPLTNIIPKPLLPIGESTILEVQILALKKHGVEQIFLATNYMSDFMSQTIGDGSRYGLKVEVSCETKPLGTCGPLSLLRDRLDEPFFMMNGDILTNIDFAALGEFALGTRANLCVVTKEINIPFRFGKVIAEGDYIVEIEEKPDYKQEILAGIYVVRPESLSLVPDDNYFGIDDMIKEMVASDLPVAKYLTQAYWVDIGQLDDYEIAKRDFDKAFAQSS